ncbi:MAG: hypothetical protein II670_08710 [Alphaproteobacteria bacterium]|nr:hypothetical protein [Alphaproteobacteria bacterium]
MNDYISREAAIEKIKEESILGKGYSYSEIGYHIIDILNDIPAADVQPVKRGVWKKHTVCENRNNGTTHIYEYSEDYMACSNCWHSFNYCDNDTERFNYCPNCGALMQDE